MTPQVTQATAGERETDEGGPADQNDERWRQWIGRGAAHDRAVHRRLLQACVLGLVAAAIAASAWFSFAPAS